MAIIEAQGLDKVMSAFELLEERGISKRPLMRILGNMMIATVDKNFEAEGRPVKWKPRSPITLGNIAFDAASGAAKTKRFIRAKKQQTKTGILQRAVGKALGNKILSGSGALKKSITMEATEDAAEVGSSGGLPYARIHQLGGTIRPKSANSLAVPCGKRLLRLKSVTIPERSYLTVPPEDTPKYALAAIAYFREAVR